MPAKEAHLAQAVKNERFYQSFDLDTTEFRDWVVVGIFYCGLHYVDAYLASRGIPHVADHVARNSYVDRLAELRPVRKEYRHLYQWSRWARYELVPCDKAQVEQLRDNELTRVRQMVMTLLGL